MGQHSMSSFTIAQFCVEKYHDGKYSELLCPFLPSVLEISKHGVLHMGHCARDCGHAWLPKNITEQQPQGFVGKPGMGPA